MIRDDRERNYPRVFQSVIWVIKGDIILIEV